MTIRTESELLALIDQPNSNISLGRSVIDRDVLRDLVESISSIAGPGGLDNDAIELIEVAGGQTFGAGSSKMTYDTTRINTAFFTLNGCVSIAILIFVTVDLFT